MNETEFNNEIHRLHNGYGVSAKDEKLVEWFNLWGRFYAYIDLTTLKAMVDTAIQKTERIPSFAQFIAIKSQIQSGSAFQSRPKTPCNVCNESGIITAKNNGHSYAFRCHCCENWKDRFEGIPLWDSNSTCIIENKVGWESTNIAQLKGLAIMRDATPKLFAKVISNYPQMVNSMESFLKETKWEGALFKSVPEPYGKTPMSESEKEMVRSNSLKQESIREEFMREHGEDKEEDQFIPNW